jgi:calcium/calmodulin-dependent protein kinase I
MILTDIRFDYNFGNILGSGSWGDVYKAMKLGRNDYYAIKAIKKETLAAGSIYLEYLTREIAALRKVDHRFVIKLNSVYEDANAIYIVTELLPKGDLLTLVTQSKKLTHEDAAKYIRSLLVALEYLHANDLIHRDVKLENILITTNDMNEPRVVLTDLGLTCFCGEEEGALTDAVGSIGYIAPEVFKNAYGKKADIFGVGVVLYCILSGTMPFAGNHSAEKNARGVATFPFKYWNDVDPNAMELVKLMMSPDPADRPTAREAIDHFWLANAGTPCVIASPKRRFKT